MNDLTLIQRLLVADAAAFREIVAAYQPSMLVTARAIVGSAFAEEVVQEAWMAILRGLPTFEGRASLKTWIIQIVANQAKSRRRREKRNIAVGHAEDVEEALDAQRFVPNGHWAVSPAQWKVASPEQILESEQLHAIIEQVIETLSDTQRAVLSLHDLDGVDIAEICKILDVGESNGRVLLHRARLKVWAAIDQYHRGEKFE